MGVYIKGITIEMLKNAPLKAVENLITSGDMVEVAEPHGRLIEAPIVDWINDDDTGTREISVMALFELAKAVDDAPTVIESEE